MAARIWFTAENTPADINRSVLNRAARLMADHQTAPLSRSDLTALRCAYREDRSANDICDAAETAQGRLQAMLQRLERFRTAKILHFAGLAVWCALLAMAIFMGWSRSGPVNGLLNAAFFVGGSALAQFADLRWPRTSYVVCTTIIVSSCVIYALLEKGH